MSEDQGEMRVRHTIQKNPNAKGLAIVVASQHSHIFPEVLYGVTKDFAKTCLIFENLMYAVLSLPNPTKEAIINVITGVAKQFPDLDENDPHYKRIVFCFAGHGSKNKYVHTSDGEIDVHNEIVWPLLPKVCPHLKHIPKLFFIDACRGIAKDKPIPTPRGGHDDQFVYSRVSGMANYLLVYSTLPTNKAYEIPGVIPQGGFWTQSLVAELQNTRNEGRDIGYILIEVNRRVNKLFNTAQFDCIQQAIAENTLLDHVFFLDEAKELKGPGMSTYVQRTKQAIASSTSLPPQLIVERGSVSPAVTSAAVLPEASDCDKKVSTFKDPELELRRLLEEKYDRGVNIEFKFKESSKGYRVTIIAPVLGYIDGEVCNTKAQARDSAISIALKSLCM